VGQRFGIAKKARLRSIKALNRWGAGNMSDILLAIEHATRKHLESVSMRTIISMSIGGPQSVAVNTAVNTAYAAGIFVVTAAGNDGRNGCEVSPASATGAFAVGAVDQLDTVAPWSNYGPCVNIYAPGVSIRSTWIPVPPGGVVPPAGWLQFPAVYMSGTSMAAPYVSGVAALLMSTLNFYDVRYVRSQLKRMAQGKIIKGFTSSPPSHNRLLNMRNLLTSYWNRMCRWMGFHRRLPHRIGSWEELIAISSQMSPFKKEAVPMEPSPAAATSYGVTSLDDDEAETEVDENSFVAYEAAEVASGNTTIPSDPIGLPASVASLAIDWYDLYEDGIIADPSSGTGGSGSTSGSTSAPSDVGTSAQGATITI